MFFRNGPEYEARLRRPFVPPKITLKEVHDAIPKHLMKINGTKASFYLLRDIVFSLALYKFASCISPWAQGNFWGYVEGGVPKAFLKASLWTFYYWTQGMVMAGIFCLGHDGGHGSLFNSKILNNIVGFIFHSYILIPYFSWRSTHHAHHKAAASMERDENYVPYTREKYNLPPESQATKADYMEMFEETPIYTFYRMFIMQFFGWWIYLTQNTMGNPKYPPGTNHFEPSSPLFKPHERNLITLSNIGVAGMAFILYSLGAEFIFKYYMIPFFLVNHWIVLFTYLHHSDPTIPHYRRGAWTFLRGALATVDRPLLGWMGRFFFHNISHDHVAHHLFLRAPFYNGPKITEAIKSVLKEDYNYDSTNTVYALYRSFTQCLFIEEEGDIVFYKNKYGEVARKIADEDMKEHTDSGWDPVEEDRLEGSSRLKYD